MKLLVIRHAIAMDRDEFQALAKTPGRASDDARPLTEDGAKKMRKNAKGLGKLVGVPDLLVTSPLLRAKQTTEILREEWKDLEPIICEALRPGSDLGAFCTWLNRQRESEKLVAIVGHEPHLSMLASWFMTGAEKSVVELKKGGACLLEFPTGRIECGKGKLLWLLTPSILRSIKS